MLRRVPQLTLTDPCQVTSLPTRETLSILEWAVPWPMGAFTLETHLTDWGTLHLVNET